jgi:manganese transport protein
VYLHSGLMTSRSAGRNDGERRRLLRAERVDIVLAMSLAGLVNLCMLAVAATLFHTGRPVSLEAVHTGLRHAIGAGAAFAFAAALLASGISSSSVGTAAGQMIMDGLLGLRLPLALRRLLTMIPAVLLLCTGIDPTRALVVSQVVLSFGIPFALVTLLMLTSRRSVMGDHVNGRPIIITMSAVAAVLVILNLMLLCEPFR